MKKKILSAVMVLALLLFLCPTQAYAAEFGTVEEVALDIRGYITSRTETFTVYLHYVPSSSDQSAIEQEIMDQIGEALDLATAHTGVPTEGDYIRNQWSDWSLDWNGAPSSGGYNISLTFTLDYFTTAQQEQEMDQAVRDLLDELDLEGQSDYEKLRGIYDYIVHNVTYDHENLNDASNTLKNTAYAALINGTAVCQGYATLFYRLALELGVDARLIIGSSSGQTHVWNIAALDGMYYNADATWDSNLAAEGLDGQCFLVSDADLADHIRSEEYDGAEFRDAYPMASESYWPGQDPAPTEPEPTKPEPTEPEPTESEPTEPEPTESEPTEPEPTEPEPTEPEPTESEPTEPEPTEPEPTEPEPTEPEPTEPEPTEPEPTEPEPTEPEPTEPEPTEPEPTEPEPTEPEPTEPEPTEPEPIDNPFIDVEEGDYFHDPVLWAVSGGITSGISPNRFGPNTPCTRAQVVTFLWRAAGSPEPSGTVIPFSDVAETDYFHTAVLWAVEQGITGGIGPDTFGPGNPCTRAQVVTFLWRAAGSPEPSGTVIPFEDVSETDYFRTAVLWAFENGITGGISQTLFGSHNPCTRAQVVTFLYKAR